MPSAKVNLKCTFEKKFKHIWPVYPGYGWIIYKYEEGDMKTTISREGELRSLNSFMGLAQERLSSLTVGLCLGGGLWPVKNPACGWVCIFETHS